MRTDGQGSPARRRSNRETIHARPARGGVGQYLELAPDEYVLPVFIILALALGGGGSPAPLQEMLLEWIALAALVAAVWLSPPDRPWPRLAMLVAGLIIVLPLAQLVPLPPNVWQALPGRETVVAALRLVGDADRWMPLSLSPSRTLASWLSLIPFVTALLLAAKASSRGRTLAIAAIALMALASVLWGAAQLASARDSFFRIYGASHSGYLTGFQANRNAAADVLVIGLLALVALYASGPKQRRSESGLLMSVAAILLVGGTLLTGSRAGIALLAGVACVCAAGFAWSIWKHGRQRLAAILLGAGVLIGGLLAWGLAGNRVVSRIASRFTATDDPRTELWTDTVYAIGTLWPWGGGIGSFLPVFLAAERLEVVDTSHPNRAHNDYLELALEAGLPGVILLAGLALLLIWRLARSLPRVTKQEDRAQLSFAAAALFVVAAHSLVDYPMRSMALATIAGVAIGFILAPTRSAWTSTEGRS